MLLSFSHLPPAQARADECSSLPSSTRGNEAKPDVEKQSAGRPYSVTRRGAWHVFIRRCRFSRGYLSACSSFLSRVCLLSIIHQCRRQPHAVLRLRTQYFGSHQAPLISAIRLWFRVTWWIPLRCFVTTARNFTPFVFFLTSYLCQINVSACSYCLDYYHWWLQFDFASLGRRCVSVWLKFAKFCLHRCQ